MVELVYRFDEKSTTSVWQGESTAKMSFIKKMVACLLDTNTDHIINPLLTQTHASVVIHCIRSNPLHKSTWLIGERGVEQPGIPLCGLWGGILIH